MRRPNSFPLVLLCGLFGCGEALPAPKAADPAPAQPQVESPNSGPKKKQEYAYDSVPPNPDAKLPPAFAGEVHPALHGLGELELAAEWLPTLQESKRKGIQLGIIDNEEAPEYSIPGPLVKLLTESKPAQARARYDAHALSAYLPERFEKVGQMWSIDPARAALPLKQFHPAVEVTFDKYHQPYGRRPGPAGAYGMLRALSEQYYDVVFRVHAEFNLRDGQALYTPACFLGRMLIDRARGTVLFFELRVPAERGVNLNILLTFRIQGDPTKLVTNIVFERVEPMRLHAGDAALAEHAGWSESLELAVAHERLKGPFYKFMDVDWVPLEDAIETAQKVSKPILAAVLTSPLDDQSC